MQHESDLRIGPPEPGQEAEALELAFAELDSEERTQQIAFLHRLAGPAGRLPQGLYAATRGGRLVAAVYWQLQPGRAGAIWPPGLQPGSHVAAIQIVRAACESLARHGVQIVQCLVRRNSQSAGETLEAAGFDHLAELYYMVSLPADFPQSLPSTPLVFEPYTPEAYARLAAILAATYEGTEDCPRLNGVRAIDDILAGYQASGDFDPARWLLVRSAAPASDQRGVTLASRQCPSGGIQLRDIGCLILADYPDQGNYELAYMGLLPDARGNRWGAAIAQYAQWRARSAGRERLVLAVDASNQPALAMYSRVGFRVWDRRSVWVRIFAHST